MLANVLMIAQVITFVLIFPIAGVKLYRKIDTQLTRVNYALFNEGKTGLVNKVDELLEKQSEIKIDIGILQGSFKEHTRDHDL